MTKLQQWVLALLFEQIKPTLGYDTIARAEAIDAGTVEPTPDEQKQFERLNAAP